jgi:hypothetical protein
MSKLLEEAIADAKAVRATALANAKAALEEAFLPKAEAMLAKKLKEEAGTGMEEEGVFDPTAAGTATSGPNHGKLTSAGKKDNNKGQEFVKFKEEVADEGDKEEGVMHSQEEEETISDEELDEILAELNSDLEEEGEAVPAPAPAPAAPVAPAPTDSAPAPAPAPAAPVAPAPAAPVAEEGTEEDMEEINLEELLQSLNESSEEEEEEEEEGKKEEDEAMEEGKKEEDEEESVSKECYEGVIKERDDAFAAIAHYKKQLNEVNLLNAKLLYTNKLFKNYSLSNEQKMKIVETFDLTQTVREVKIAYTSLAESFNFGKSTVKKNTAAQTITEGLASKPVNSTKPAPAAIVENTNTQAFRFQTLAGIKKA